MKKLLFLLSVTVIFSGCVNKRGISATYYNDCNEYYDVQGNYHKECDENMLEFKTLKELVAPDDEEPKGNVW